MNVLIFMLVSIVVAHLSITMGNFVDLSIVQVKCYEFGYSTLSICVFYFVDLISLIFFFVFRLERYSV